MERFVGTKNLVICSSYNAPTCTLFRNLKKEIFSMQGAWHSPPGFLYYYLTTPPSIRLPISSTWGHAELLCGCAI